jgi:peptidoglycan hydrolase-like protein with peptidoglycan-binding domain
MRTLLLAAAASAAFTFPALAQTQLQTTAPPPMPQIEPNDQSIPPMPPPQAGTSTQGIDPSALSRQQVVQIQQALDKSGFGAGRADGIWGAQTQAALVNFQKSKNMGAANGELDAATLAALELNPADFAQGQRGAAPAGATP